VDRWKTDPHDHERKFHGREADRRRDCRGQSGHARERKLRGRKATELKLHRGRFPHRVPAAKAAFRDPDLATAFRTVWS